MHSSPRLIFPLLALHYTAPRWCVVERLNGDLLACWYQGTGEWCADDVAVFGARRRHAVQSSGCQHLRCSMAGISGYQPVPLRRSARQALLIWQTIIANEWQTALIKYKISSRYLSDGRPEWETSDTLILNDRNSTENRIARQW